MLKNIHGFTVFMVKKDKVTHSKNRALFTQAFIVIICNISVLLLSRDPRSNIVIFALPLISTLNIVFKTYSLLFMVYGAGDYPGCFGQEI